MRVTTRWLTLFLLLIGASSCGYLDQDLLTDDEAFDESFGVGGLGLTGYGMSGCGGMGYLGRAHRAPRLGMGGYAMLELEAMSISVMSDQDILESTTIDVIDESEPEPTESASLAAKAYYDQLDARNRAIAETY